MARNGLRSPVVSTRLFLNRRVVQPQSRPQLPVDLLQRPKHLFRPLAAVTHIPRVPETISLNFLGMWASWAGMVKAYRP
jgi:hypothetical protein